MLIKIKVYRKLTFTYLAILKVTLHWCAIYIIIIIIIMYQHGYFWPSHHTSLLSIASGRSSRLHPVSAQSCCYAGSSWASCLCSSMWRGPQEYITYELVPTSPAVSRVSGSSNLGSFRDGWLGAVQLLLCGVLSPGLVQYCSQHSRVIAVQLFLHPFC